MRMQTESGLHPVRRYGRAQSRPVTDLGAIACGEPRVEELLGLLDDAVVPRRRIDILLEIGRVYRDELDDSEAAIVALRAALQEDFCHSGVATKLEQLVEETGTWADLISELIRDAETLAADNTRLAGDLWVRIARWYLSPMGYRGYAIEALRQALELAPDNVDALAMLASIWREDGYHLELAGVLKRQAEATVDPAARVEVLLALADICDTHLDDMDGAIAACSAALDADPSCMAVYDALRGLLRDDDSIGDIVALLAAHANMIQDADDHVELMVDIARLYGERLGDWARADHTWEMIDPGGAVARLTELIDAKPGATEAADLHYRVARYRLPADEKTAEWHLHEALAENPAHVQSAYTLAALYQRRAEYGKARLMLDRAIEHTADPEQRITFIIDKARILADHLGDLDGAAAACRDALDAGASSVTLSLVLARVFARQSKWAELRTMLADIEPDIVASGDSEHIGTLYQLIAQASEELGDHDQALAYFNEAHSFAPDADTHRQLADQYFAREQWPEAAREYRALLDTGSQLIGTHAIHYRLGVALRESGHMTGALAAFTTVTEAEPDHLPALRARAALLRTLGRYPTAADALRTLLDVASIDDAPRLHIDLGDLYRDHLGQPRRALAEYTAAAAAAPDHHTALQRKLDTATSLGDWSTAIATIEHFAATEADLNRRGAYLHAAAVIYRDHLRALDTAAETFEAALDAYFAECPTGADLARSLRTFAELDTLHTSRRAWEDQADAYQRMIGRLPAGHPVLVELWHALGEVYRSRLDDLNMAATAFEAARTLEPDHMERRAILAELYAINSDDPAAAHEHHTMLARDPARAESYRALKDLYLAANNMDQAWCAARALVFLDQAEPDERELFDRYHAHALADMKATIDAEMRHHLAPTAACTVAHAMALLRPVAAAVAPNTLRLRDDQKIDPAHDRTPRVRMLAHIAAALGYELPDLYDQAKKAGPLTATLRLVDGEVRAALALRCDHMRAGETTAAFFAGRALALLEPTSAMTQLFDTDRLHTVINWTLGRADDSKLTAELTRAAKRHLRPDQHEQLLRIQRRLAATDTRRALDRWQRISAITADRVGFVVCGDLSAAARAIATLKASAPGLSAHARILELLRFSVTDEHAAMRRHLCGRI